MSLIVQKFGGTSVADLERIRNVAKRIANTYDQGNDVVVILSAMAGITDNLIDMAGNVTESPDKRELDVLLATGEQTTSALLAMTLKSMNYPALGNDQVMHVPPSRPGSPEDHPSPPQAVIHQVMRLGLHKSLPLVE